MFRAAKLNKVMVIGPSSEMKKTSGLLHDMNILHIDDFVDGAGGMSIGQPLEGSEYMSKDLVKVRRTISLLGIDGTPNISKPMRMDEVLAFMQKQFPAVEKQALELSTKKEKATSKLQDLSALRKAIVPLANFSKAARFDIESLEAVAGYCRKDITGTLKKISPNLKIETVKSKKRLMFLIYYPKNVEKKLLDILDLAGFENIEIPTFRGTVADRIKKLDEETSVLEAEIKTLGENISKARTHSELKLLAAEEHLSNEVEKAELPLRCATTDHLFTIEGWVKKTDAPRLKEGIERSLKGKVTVEILEKGEEEGDSAPVLLKHSAPVRPFQYLVDIYSTPNLKEIDPTLIMALIFPIFFGLMIGDLGYGIILVIMGFILKKRPVFGIGGNAVGNIIIIGGIAAIIFGTFLFGDAFGLPFHGHHAGEMDWHNQLGINIPYHAPIGKLDANSVITLLVLSVSAGFFHMGLGLCFGLINSATHKDGKHALSRVGWLLLLLGIFILAMNLAQNTGLGHWISQNILFNLQADSLLIYGLEIPWATIYLAAPGLLLLVVTEGGFAIIESLGMLTNLISYTRLAAVGVAKAALALAINVICIEIVMTMLGGIIGIIVGIICIAVGQFFIVVLLGTLSAGIQAVRLNYVEFFMKFYEGGGTPFRTFGATNRYAMKQEARVA